MVPKELKKTTGSPKVEVGEIDTSSPFQSVKDAVNLFGEGVSSGEKPAIKKIKPYSAERVLANETRLHFAQKELNKLKEQFKNAETTKHQAIAELERAQRTVEDLIHKLETVRESKGLASKATEAAKEQVKLLEEASNGISKGNYGSSKQELETSRQKYLVELAELDAAKQELRCMRQDYDAILETKEDAIKQAAEAEETSKANKERVGELPNEIASMQESIGQVILATKRAQEEEGRILAEKDVQKESYEASIQEVMEKMLTLKRDFDPELSEYLETQLAVTTFEIEDIRRQMDYAKDKDLNSVRMVTCELDEAKKSLHKVAEEESSQWSMVESLWLELQNVKKEHSEMRENVAETESIAGNLHVKLQKAKDELDVALGEESKVTGASKEMIATFHRLILEGGNARREMEGMKKQAEDLKKVSESTRILLEEAEKKLRAALEDAEEAKAAEASALEQIKSLSDRTNTESTSISGSGFQIRVSREEYESLRRKVEEADKIAEMKVAAAMAQVEAVKASESEALERSEAMQREIDDMKAATNEALKKAEMAEAAKKAVEGELRKWRQREQNKVAEAESRILVESEMSLDLSSNNHRFQKHNQPVNAKEARKLDKEKTPVSKKILRHNLSSIFHRKKNQVVGSPSYLPGEKPV